MGRDVEILDRAMSESDIKKLMDERYNPIASALVNGIWYGAIRNKKNQVVAGIILIDLDNSRKELVTNLMSEFENPEYHTCPERILNLLSKTNDEKALLWRDNCRKYNVKKNKKEPAFIKKSIEDMQKVISYPMDTKVSFMDSYLFGKYPQIIKNKKIPIEWILLDLDKKNKKALLLSKYILDVKCFDDSAFTINKPEKARNSKKIKNCKKTSYWEVSTLRKWLNGDFIKEAFNNSEKRQILETKNETDGCISKDKIFLLSASDVKKYFKQKNMKNSIMKLTAKATKYAKKIKNYGEKLWVEKYVEMDSANSHYWLRSKGKAFNWINCVKYYGSIEFDGRPQNEKDVGVRPAIWVKMD